MSGGGQFTRRDHLLGIEEWAQNVWKESRAYERNAPEDEETLKGKKKYMATFPYPYMNGKLHLGHAFTVTKAEFAARFHQLQGEAGFFPFAFHCTGMPIQAAAGNLARELASDEVEEVAPDAPVVAEEAEAALVPGVYKSKKSKAKAKSGGMSQFDILKSMGIDESEIPKFVDPYYWLSYFPPRGQADLTRFGLAIDWRRSFITTDANPLYDAFIKWQFRKLKAGGFIGFGNRPAIFSRREQQPCADHDRASGEGVGAQEYTLIKLEVLADQVLPQILAQRALGRSVVSLVAATLRPETMYGQTNCFVLPEGKYGLYFMGETQGYFVCSQRAADNLVWQGLGEKFPVQSESGLLGAHCLGVVQGADLLGLKVKAPLSTYEHVHVLPMLTISMNKGTGIVTSVPSDSPDDFACLRDWKTKANWRTQYGVKEEWVVGFDAVPIIDMSAVAADDESGDSLLVERLLVAEKVESHRDKDKLETIKKAIYLKGFESGVMKVGDFAGRPVKEAKPLIKQALVASGHALVYYEPESVVVSRSGDECVVALCDQWYINYGEEEWMHKVIGHMTSGEGNFTMFNPKAFNQQKAAVEWFKTWACSRTFGLGTRLPWDEKWIIESLSDSTIYMAYYTIAHILADTVTADLAVDELFDYVFLLGNDVQVVLDKIAQTASGAQLNRQQLAEKIEQMRREFTFWYPMDLRVSGKDLILNHLTMSLYIHAAIWPSQPELWPRAFFTNGHIEVDAEKMSKSKGNFLTIEHVNKEYGADATRIALADAGDDLENANFANKTANDSVMGLFNLLQWINEHYKPSEAGSGARSKSSMDLIFKNELARLVQECDAAYKKMNFRGALKAAWFDLANLKEQYRLFTEGEGMHPEMIELYVRTQCIMLYPIAPHVCEYIWMRILNQSVPLAVWSTSNQSAVWSTIGGASGSYDLSMGRKFQILQESLRGFRLELKKWKDGANMPNTAIIFIAKEYLPYQQEVLKLLATSVAFDPATFEPVDKKYTSELKNLLPAGPMQGMALKFAAFHVQTEVKARGLEALELSLPFDETELFLEQVSLIKKQLGVTLVEIRGANEPCPEDSAKQGKREAAVPGKPSVLFLRR